MFNWALGLGKRGMRNEVLTRRLLMSRQANQECSQRIAANVAGMAAFQAATTIMAYWPFRNEVDTSMLVRSALAAGKRVVLPRTIKADRRLAPHIITDIERDLKPGVYGIMEPLPELPEARPDEIDFVIVPGLVFDRVGNRIGYGGGYYDRFLPALQRAAKVAVAFDLQLVQRVPADERDRPVDYIVTEKEVIDCRAERGSP
ncbi:MAG: 5-formyltetrahydrofolate cyclo-ligase [Chloroflexota bacterium]